MLVLFALLCIIASFHSWRDNRHFKMERVDLSGKIQRRRRTVKIQPPKPKLGPPIKHIPIEEALDRPAPKLTGILLGTDHPINHDRRVSFADEKEETIYRKKSGDVVGRVVLKM